MKHLVEVQINSPQINETFSGSPNFNIFIIEGTANSTWYSLDDGIINITFTSLSNTIDNAEWNKKGNGIVTIIFHANDSRGWTGFSKITIIKNDPDLENQEPEKDVSIPSFSELDLIFALITSITLLILIKRKKLSIG